MSSNVSNTIVAREKRTFKPLSSLFSAFSSLKVCVLDQFDIILQDTSDLCMFELVHSIRWTLQQPIVALLHYLRSNARHDSWYRCHPATNPKGPKIEKNQSRMKFSISVENFNLACNIQSWPSEFPTKIGVWWAARLKISISLENFNPGGRSWFFSIFGPLGKHTKINLCRRWCAAMHCKFPNDFWKRDISNHTGCTATRTGGRKPHAGSELTKVSATVLSTWRIKPDIYAMTDQRLRRPDTCLPWCRRTARLQLRTWLGLWCDALTQKKGHYAICQHFLNLVGCAGLIGNYKPQLFL